MKIEKLEELHQHINALRSLNLEECAALIGEVWRLRVAHTGKDLEVSYWKDGHDQLKAELDRMTEANRLLQRKTTSSRPCMACPTVISKTAGAIARCGCENGAKYITTENHVNGNHT